MKVYISLTSIFKNQDILFKTLKSILKQSQLPDKIFLYLSEEPYILDYGFKEKIITHIELLKFINNSKIIIVKWVANAGSYRKLLPLLKEKWNEDCLIITIDDDTVYDNNLIKNMVNDYNKHKCVINYRGFTPKMNVLSDFDYSKRDTLINKHIYNFPTGKSGILYHPNFFHKTGELIFNKNIYSNYCKTQDDIWFYIVRVKNNVPCFIDNKKWMSHDLTNGGLYTINLVNNLNTTAFNNTLKHI